MTLPTVLLRLEALAVTVASVIVYRRLGGGWGSFALLLFVPDLSMLGYLASPRVGSYTYNAVHTLLTPALLCALLLSLYEPLHRLLLPCVWFAHIGLDRLLGYGLKYPTAFKDTHLQRV